VVTVLWMWTRWMAAALAVLLSSAGAWGGDLPPSSLYEDPVARGVGDVVIVHLDPVRLGSSVTGQSSTTTNSSLVSLFTQQGLTSSQASTTSWQQALSGDLAATVVGVTPEGLFRVRGARSVVVDGSTQTVEIEGLLRPQDLGADDTVAGSRLANVSVTVRGHLTTQQRLGLWDWLALIFGAGVLLKVLP
jgi:flagellar basal body L-ring protein FlgH